jgi:hypothetical protein
LGHFSEWLDAGLLDAGQTPELQERAMLQMQVELSSSRPPDALRDVSHSLLIFARAGASPTTISETQFRNASCG